MYNVGVGFFFLHNMTLSQGWILKHQKINEINTWKTYLVRPVDHRENISGWVSSKTADCWKVGGHITGAGTFHPSHSCNLSLASAVNTCWHRCAELNGSMEASLLCAKNGPFYLQSGTWDVCIPSWIWKGTSEAYTENKRKSPNLSRLRSLSKWRDPAS